MTFFPISHKPQLENSYQHWRSYYSELNSSNIKAIAWPILKTAIPAMVVWIGCHRLPPRAAHIVMSSSGKVITMIVCQLINPICLATFQLFLQKPEIVQQMTLCKQTKSLKELSFLLMFLYVAAYSFYECVKQPHRTSPLKSSLEDLKMPDPQAMLAYLKQHQLTLGDFLFLNENVQGMDFPKHYSLEDRIASTCSLVNQKKLQKIFAESISHQDKIFKVDALMKKRKFFLKNVKYIPEATYSYSLRLIGAQFFKLILLTASFVYLAKLQGVFSTALLFSLGLILNESHLRFLFNERPLKTSLNIEVVHLLKAESILTSLYPSLLLRKEETDFYVTPSIFQMTAQLWASLTNMVIAYKMSQMHNPMFSFNFRMSLGQTFASYMEDIYSKYSQDSSRVPLRDQVMSYLEKLYNQSVLIDPEELQEAVRNAKDRQNARSSSSPKRDSTKGSSTPGLKELYSKNRFINPLENPDDDDPS
ncbi:MAG: hypothetical protein QRY71_03840 [Candidatus Rhabdochlamydia sp.]